MVRVWTLMAYVDTDDGPRVPSSFVSYLGGDDFAQGHPIHGLGATKFKSLGFE